MRLPVMTEYRACERVPAGQQEPTRPSQSSDRPTDQTVAAAAHHKTHVTSFKEEAQRSARGVDTHFFAPTVIVATVSGFLQKLHQHEGESVLLNSRTWLMFHRSHWLRARENATQLAFDNWTGLDFRGSFFRFSFFRFSFFRFSFFRFSFLRFSRPRSSDDDDSDDESDEDREACDLFLFLWPAEWDSRGGAAAAASCPDISMAPCCYIYPTRTEHA